MMHLNMNKLQNKWLNNICPSRGYKAVVDQILSGPYTGYLLHPVATHLPEYEACIIEHTGFFTSKVNTAFGFQKNSTFKQLFNYGLIKMIENGEMQRSLEKHGFVTGKEKKCGGKRKGQQLGFENILVVFIVLCAGIIISLAMLVVEYLIKRM